jgi:hypothetical protein
MSNHVFEPTLREYEQALLTGPMNIAEGEATLVLGLDNLDTSTYLRFLLSLSSSVDFRDAMLFRYQEPELWENILESISGLSMFILAPAMMCAYTQLAAGNFARGRELVYKVLARDPDSKTALTMLRSIDANTPVSTYSGFFDLLGKSLVEREKNWNKECAEWYATEKEYWNNNSF